MDLLTFLNILSELGRIAALVLLIALNEEIKACFRGSSRSEAEKRWLK